MRPIESYTLRPLAPSDLDAFYEMLQRNRPRLEAFFAGLVAQTQTKEDTALYLQNVAAQQQHKSYLPYLLLDPDTQHIVVFLDLKNIDWRIPKAELGCFADHSVEGKKITQQALQRFIDFCFQQHQFLKLFLRTHEGNKAAQRIAEKCGFELEGKIRKDYKTTSGEVVDLLYYGQINPTCLD